MSLPSYVDDYDAYLAIRLRNMCCETCKCPKHCEHSCTECNDCPDCTCEICTSELHKGLN